jgi:hypothetical protein
VIDMVCTSPPYGKIRKSSSYCSDYDFKAIALELLRVVREGGVVAWNIDDQVIRGGESGVRYEQALYFRDIGFLIDDSLVIAKHGPSFPSTTRYHQIWEMVFILRKKGKKGCVKTFNPIMDRKNKCLEGSWGQPTARGVDGVLRPGKRRTEVNEEGARFNVWYVNKGKGFSVLNGDNFAYQHGAIMSESLAEDLIRSWSNPGDWILDPFVGSGTTLKMALSLGRHAVGIDVSPESCAMAQERVKRQILRRRGY